MADKIHGFLPLTAEAASTRQRLFLRYYTGTMMDLVILNLFAEYFPEQVHVDNFTISLLAAVLLQFLLKLTIMIEHKVAAIFKARRGAFMVFMRFFSAWAILFLSKFVILEAISFALRGGVHFEGIYHGIVWLILVVVVMLVAEEIVVRIFRKLA
jgi:hypothetical protein